MNLTLLSFILSLLALAGLVYVIVGFRSLEKLKQIFLRGSQGQDLEAALKAIVRDIQNLGDTQALLAEELNELARMQQFTIQKFGLVRFNPFADGGGSFSFSLALLDGHNNGVVLTNMHGRERNRIYTKSIQDGVCDIPLTDEEQEAVLMAIKKSALVKPKKRKPKVEKVIINGKDSHG